MLLNLVRFFFLYVALHKSHGWTVRWNRGLPTASSKPDNLIYLRYGNWVVYRTDEAHEWEETHRTLWAVFASEVSSRFSFSFVLFQFLRFFVDSALSKIH